MVIRVANIDGLCNQLESFVLAILITMYRIRNSGQNNRGIESKINWDTTGAKGGVAVRNQSGDTMM